MINNQKNIMFPIISKSNNQNKSAKKIDLKNLLIERNKK